MYALGNKIALALHIDILESRFRLKTGGIYILTFCLGWVIGIGQYAAASEQGNETKAGNQLNFESLLNKAPLANGAVPAQIILIQNEENFREIQSGFDELKNELIGTIDFSRFLVVYIIAGNKASTGYAVSVQSVWRSADTISVSICEKEPGDREMVEDAESIPIEIISLERSSISPDNYRQKTFKLVDMNGDELARAMFLP